MSDAERIEQLEAELDEARASLKEYRSKWATLILASVANLKDEDRAVVAKSLSRHERGVLRRLLEGLS